MERLEFRSGPEKKEEDPYDLAETDVPPGEYIGDTRIRAKQLAVQHGRDISFRHSSGEREIYTVKNSQETLAADLGKRIRLNEGSVESLKHEMERLQQRITNDRLFLEQMGKKDA